MTYNMCGHCERWIDGRCSVNDATPAYGESCLHKPSRWIDKHEGKGRKFGYPVENVILNYPAKKNVQFQSKDGQVSFTADKGKGKKNAKPKSKPVKGSKAKV